MTWPAEALETYAQHQIQKAINKENNSLFMETSPQGSNTVQKEKKRSLPNLIARFLPSGSFQMEFSW